MRIENRARHALNQLTAFAFRQYHRILSSPPYRVCVCVCVERSLMAFRSESNGSVFSQLHISIANTCSLFAEIIIYSIKVKYTKFKLDTVTGRRMHTHRINCRALLA